MSQPSLAVVVFGCPPLPTGDPSPALTRRLQRAVQEYRRHPYATVVVSGGASRGRACEARVMHAWLVEHGLSPERVLLDEAAVDTLDNAYNCAVLVKACGAQRVILVTERYHMERANLVLRGSLDAAGLASVRLERASAPDNLKGPRRLLRRLREWLASWRDRYRMRRRLHASPTSITD